MKLGDKLTLQINKFAYLGYGLAKYNNFTIFIPKGIPGDKVEGTITTLKKSHAFLRIDNIISPSPMRIEPDCPAFPDCGGCDYLNLSYEKQVFFKETILKEQISRTFREKPRFYPMETSESSEYRNKVDLKYSPDDDSIGFYSKRTNSVVPLPIGEDFCLIQPKGNQAILDLIFKMFKKEFRNKLKKLILRRSFSTGQKLVVAIGSFEFDDEPFDIDEDSLKKLHVVSLNFIDRKNRFHNVYGENFYLESVGKYNYKVAPLSFFQTNSNIFKKMMDTLDRILHIAKDEIVLDLYCGLGAFSLLLSENAGKVYAIESDDNAVMLAKENAKENGCENITFFSGKVRNRLKKIVFEKKPSFALVDPPRKGMHYKAMDSLLEISPDTVIYISCHLPTFIRDAQKLVDSGYRFLAVYPFDMFPHTFHMEVMGYFTK